MFSRATSISVTLAASAARSAGDPEGVLDYGYCRRGEFASPSRMGRGVISSGVESLGSMGIDQRIVCCLFVSVHPVGTHDDMHSSTVGDRNLIVASFSLLMHFAA